MSYSSGPQQDIPSKSHKSGSRPVEDKSDTRSDLVIALENEVGIPVDTLGQVSEYATFDKTLVLIDWYMDQPGKPTRRAMRPTEFKPIPEG
jgi:hypothetical protein